MSKERPILFSGEMVRAILEGRKTQTRRIVKNLSDATMNMLKKCQSVRIEGHKTILDFGYKKLELNSDMFFECPFGKVGDRLWVRETWLELIKGKEAFYRASFGGSHKDLKWKPSIHMPRWASRITLEITNVRVERLQDISDEDARAEGLEGVVCLHQGVGAYGCADCYNTGWIELPKMHFHGLWESINGPGSWEKNPWVWCIEFKNLNPAAEKPKEN